MSIVEFKQNLFFFSYGVIFLSLIVRPVASGKWTEWSSLRRSSDQCRFVKTKGAEIMRRNGRNIKFRYGVWHYTVHGDTGKEGGCPHATHFTCEPENFIPLTWCDLAEPFSDTYMFADRL